MRTGGEDKMSENGLGVGINKDYFYLYLVHVKKNYFNFVHMH